MPSKKKTPKARLPSKNQDAAGRFVADNTASVGVNSKYLPAHAALARNYAQLGATDQQIAEMLGIVCSTFYIWKIEHEDFAAALGDGKRVADDRVVNSLFQSAVGYSHPDVHITNFQGEITKTEVLKHYPPNPTSCIFWLKNRRKEEWKDRHDHEVGGRDGKPIETTDVTDRRQLARQVAFLLAQGLQVSNGST